MTEIVIGIVIVLLIFLLILYASRKTESKLLYGFWVGDTDFCERAGLISYYLAIDDVCALVINTADKQIISEVFELRKEGICFAPTVCEERNFNMRVIRDEEHSGALPDKFSVKFYPIAGRLYLYDGDELLAELAKETRI